MFKFKLHSINHCLAIAAGILALGSALNGASLASGGAHSLVVANNQALWVWGGNQSGQLGLGSTANINQPTRLGALTDWAHVSAGLNHSLAIKSNGSLWAWGANSFGQLGDGTTATSLTPKQIGSSTQWIAVSAGANYSLALRADGTLWGWGTNATAQLAINPQTSANLTQPLQIASSLRFKAIAAGANHSIAVATDGKLYAWGNGAFGRLGIGALGGTWVYATPQQVGTSSNWTAVAASEYASFALNSNNELFAWGSNSNGRLGVGVNSGSATDRTTPVKVAGTWQSISSGPNHTLAIATNGRAWGWGNSNGGRLGIILPPGSSNAFTPVQLLGDATWTAAAAGADFSILLSTSGIIYSTGNNNQGQLGNGSTVNQDNWDLSYFGVPDLVLPQVRLLTAAPSAGGVIDVELEINNQGTGSVPANSGLSANFYLSKAAELDETALRLPNVTPSVIAEPVAAGTSLFKIFTIALDVPLEDGIYNLFAQINPTGAVTETTLVNNVRKAPVTLTFQPDLTPDITLPRNYLLNRGEMVQATIKIRNLGNSIVQAGVVGHIVAKPRDSFGSVFTGPEVKIGEFTVNQPIPAGGQLEMANMNVRIPEFLNPAVYTLGVLIDANNTLQELRKDNNLRFYETRTVTLVPGTTNLSLKDGLGFATNGFQPPIDPNSISVRFGGSAQWYGFNSPLFGNVASAPVPASTMNDGDVAWFEIAINGPFRVEFDWEIDSGSDQISFTIDGSAPQNAEIVHTIQGVQSRISYSQVVESFVAPRKLRWTFRRGAGDPASYAVVQNLVLTGVSLPDLIVSQLDYNSEATPVFVMGRHDSFLDIVVAGINVGKDMPSNPTPGRNQFEVEVRLSKDRIWGNSDDVVLGTLQEIQNINSGNGYLYGHVFDLHPDNYGCIPEGEYYLAVFVDSTGRYQEFNEQNNIRFSDEPDVVIEWRPQVYLTEGLREGDNTSFNASELKSVRYQRGIYYRLGDLQVEIDLKNVGCADLLPGEMFEMVVNLKGYEFDLATDEETGVITLTRTSLGVLDRELATLRYDRGLPASSTISFRSSFQLPLYNEATVWNLILGENVGAGWIPPFRPEFDMSLRDTTAPAGLYPPEGDFPYFNSPKNNFSRARNTILFGLEFRFKPSPDVPFIYDEVWVQLPQDIIIDKTPFLQTYSEWADFWSLWVNQGDFFFGLASYPDPDLIRTVTGPFNNQDIVYTYSPITGFITGFANRPDYYTNFAEYALGLNPHKAEPFAFDRDEDMIIITPVGSPIGLGSKGVEMDTFIDDTAKRYMALTFNALSIYSNGGVRYRVQACDSPEFASGVVDLFVYEPFLTTKEALREFRPVGSSVRTLVSLMDNHYLYRLTVRDTVPMTDVNTRFLRLVMEPVQTLP